MFHVFLCLKLLLLYNNFYKFKEISMIITHIWINYLIQFYLAMLIRYAFYLKKQISVTLL